MKKFLMVLFLAFGFMNIISDTSEARRGCCSHHGGVCGCACCDGKPLSAKCSPYYPWCSGDGVAPAPKKTYRSYKKRVIINPCPTITTTSSLDIKNSASEFSATIQKLESNTRLKLLFKGHKFSKISTGTQDGFILTGYYICD